MCGVPCMVMCAVSCCLWCCLMCGVVHRVLRTVCGAVGSHSQNHVTMDHSHSCTVCAVLDGRLHGHSIQKIASKCGLLSRLCVHMCCPRLSFSQPFNPENRQQVRPPLCFLNRVWDWGDAARHTPLIYRGVSTPHHIQLPLYANLLEADVP